MDPFGMTGWLFGLIQTIVSLYSLGRARRERREVYRREVPQEDVGYVTALLRSLYSEDRFQRWLLSSDYRGGRR